MSTRTQAGPQLKANYNVISRDVSKRLLLCFQVRLPRDSEDPVTMFVDGARLVFQAHFWTRFLTDNGCCCVFTALALHCSRRDQDGYECSVKTEEFCIKNDEFCMPNDDFGAGRSVAFFEISLIDAEARKKTHTSKKLSMDWGASTAYASKLRRSHLQRFFNRKSSFSRGNSPLSAFSMEIPLPAPQRIFQGAFLTD